MKDARTAAKTGATELSDAEWADLMNPPPVGDEATLDELDAEYGDAEQRKAALRRHDA